MNTHVLLLLAFTLLLSCRTSRDTIEIQDARAPTRPSSDDYLNVGRSVQTTFAISAISLPTTGRVYEYLDLELRRPGETNGIYTRHRYQTGEALAIEPHQDYEVLLTAFKGSAELYSTRFCAQRQSFRATEGPNSFTASLCSKPESP
jgi:hypothetical protein